MVCNSGMFEDAFPGKGRFGNSVRVLVPSHTSMSRAPINGDGKLRVGFEGSKDVGDEDEGESLSRVRTRVGNEFQRRHGVGEDVDLRSNMVGREGANVVACHDEGEHFSIKGSGLSTPAGLKFGATEHKGRFRGASRGT